MPVLRFTIEGETDQQTFKQAGKAASKAFNQSYKQSSEGAAQTQKQTQATRNQEEALKDLRKELRRKISLVDADLRLGNKSQEEAEQSIRKIKQWAEAQGAFNRKHLVGAQNLKTFANAQNRAKNDFRGMSAVTNRANQVIFDLNQGLADLPYGMRGVSNNIPFVINGFQRFAKSAREDGISPMKGFWAALTSPAGLIGTAAAVIPTLILFAQQFDLFGESAKDAKKEVEGVNKALNKIQSRGEGLLSGGFFDRKFIKADLALLEEGKRILEERDKLRERETRALQSNLDAYEGARKAIEANKEAFKDLGLDVPDDLDKVNEKIKTLKGELEGLESEGRDARDIIGSYAERLESEVSPAIDRFNLNLSGSEQNLIDVRKQLQRSASNYRRMIEAGNDASENIAVLKALEKQIEEINNALGETKQLKDISLEVTAPKDELLPMPELDFKAFEKQFKNQLDAGTDFINEAQQIDQQAQLAQLSGFQQEKLRIEQKFLNRQTEIRRLAARAGLDATKQIQQLELIKHREIEEAKTEITKQQADQRRDQALTAIGATGTALQVLFEDQKGIAIAGAIIEAGAAIVRQFKDLPLYAAIPAAALVAAKTAKQIEQMKQVKPGSGGAPDVGGGSVQEGFSTTDIEPQGAQRSPTNFARSGNQMSIVVEANNVLPDTEFSVRAERGRDKRERDITSIGV